MSRKTNGRRGRRVLSPEEKLWKEAAKACGVSVQTAKRYVRNGEGNPQTSLWLGRIFGLTHDELVYGTRGVNKLRSRVPK